MNSIWSKVQSLKSMSNGIRGLMVRNFEEHGREAGMGLHRTEQMKCEVLDLIL